MAAMVCSVLGRKKVISLVMASVCFTHPGPHSVLWSRGCSQYKQVPSNEDMPVAMENPYKEPLRKCILCGKSIDYENVQVFGGRNRKKSQKRLKELK
ncbi:28S ribosomal protein S18c, mitochondrial-like isoform X3 [Otolemur garnettii]|uniref:28S ribosomal protein S18c, mitochondrial-like isoform X3 n=1 Tax=Otolemur garnettii TaxID=30611 RepID=UPI000644234C|nr:28S ribosomal protein S18c, mitochondrial-like isoform X3 [Otolemur garnettii]